MGFRGSAVEVAPAHGWLAESTSTVGAGADLDILLRTNAVVMELFVAAGVTGDFEAFFFEAPTSSADGAALTLIDVNRVDPATPTGDVFTGPTLSADGTPLVHVLILGGGDRSAIKNIGAQGGSALPWILAPSTDYLLRFTNTTAGDQTLDAHLFWTERSP